MSLLSEEGAFPPVLATKGDVTADERSSAIDFVNRVNLHFECNDQENMTNAFSPYCKAYFSGMTLSGKEEIRAMFRDKYHAMIPGVNRYATNHIVDRDEETGGVIVRYQLQLIRYAWPREVTAPRGTRIAEALVTSDGLPRIWQNSKIMDRLKKMGGGWCICERCVGDNIIDEKMNADRQPS
jgi:hypothetical protein